MILLDHGVDEGADAVIDADPAAGANAGEFALPVHLVKGAPGGLDPDPLEIGEGLVGRDEPIGGIMSRHVSSGVGGLARSRIIRPSSRIVMARAPSAIAAARFDLAISKCS